MVAELTTEFAGGTKRVKCSVPYQLIPPAGIRRTAQRFQLGAVNYGEDNWKNSLDTIDHARVFLKDVYNHMFEHMLRLNDPNDKDDNLSAIGWAVMVIAFAEEKFQRPWRLL